MAVQTHASTGNNWKIPERENKFLERKGNRINHVVMQILGTDRQNAGQNIELNASIGSSSMGVWHGGVQVASDS